MHVSPWQRASGIRACRSPQDYRESDTSLYANTDKAEFIDIRDECVTIDELALVVARISGVQEWYLAEFMNDLPQTGRGAKWRQGMF